MTEVLIIWTNSSSLPTIYWMLVDQHTMALLDQCVGHFADSDEESLYPGALDTLRSWLENREPILDVDELTTVITNYAPARRIRVVVCGEATPNLVPDEVAS